MRPVSAEEFGWQVIELLASTHVVPLYETAHVLDEVCWCCPRVQTKDSNGKAFAFPLVTHQDIFERLGSDVAITDVANSTI